MPQVATYLALFLRQYFNNDLIYIKIENPYSGEYGKLNKQERKKIVKDTIFSFEKNRIKNKTILFIDDIINTGAVSEKIAKKLLQNGAEKVVRVCLVKIDDNLADSAPQIEAALSNKEITSKDVLFKIITSPNYYLMSRTCKKLLTLPKREMVDIIDRLPYEKLM